MSKEVDTVVLYHANCIDGKGAAMAVKEAFEPRYSMPTIKAVYVAVSYGDELPEEVNGKHVIIVDFSFPLDVIHRMEGICKSLLILDHHKTAEAALRTLPALTNERYSEVREKGLVRAKFDMNESGASMASEYFLGYVTPLIQHIKDRDLWKFELPNTREIHAALSLFPDEFTRWCHEVEEHSMNDLIRIGKTLREKQDKDIKGMIDTATREVFLWGMKAPAINIPPMWASDACNILAKGKPFAVAYYHTKDHVCFSLRSAEDGLDVSQIAGHYQGGGHKHAAGFRLTHEQAQKLIEWV